MSAPQDTPRPAPGMWRLGNHVPLHVYEVVDDPDHRKDVPIGVFHAARLARLAVEHHNAYLAAPAAEPQTFEQELAALLNAHGIDNRTDTPDYVLARFIESMVMLIGLAVRERDAWAGRPTLGDQIGQGLEPRFVSKFHGGGAPVAPIVKDECTCAFKADRGSVIHTPTCPWAPDTSTVGGSAVRKPSCPRCGRWHAEFEVCSVGPSKHRPWPDGTTV